MSDIERRPTGLELDIRYKSALARVNYHMERSVQLSQPIVHNKKTGEALVLGDPVTGVRMWNLVYINQWGRQSSQPMSIFMTNMFSDPVLAVGLITDEALIELRGNQYKTLTGSAIRDEVIKTHARRREFEYKEILVRGLEEAVSSLEIKPTIRNGWRE